MILRTHREAACRGQFCCIHNPSQHHMREWPINWRPDMNVMERICPHGIGHPDPDDAAHKIRIGQDALTLTIHGCDGCCRKFMTKTKIALIALLGSAALTAQVNAVLPVGTTLRTNEEQVTVVPLQNGVVTEVNHIDGLDQGTWLVWGSCTVQDRVMEGVFGEYIWTFTAISLRSNQMPDQIALKYLDARPYNTGFMARNQQGQWEWSQNLYWWFGANPPARIFRFNGDPSVSLVALSWAGQGGVAPSAQAFGAMIAQKISIP